MYMCSEKYIPQHEHNIGKIDDQKVRVQLLVCRIYIPTVLYGEGGTGGWPLIKLKLGICQPPKSHAHFYNQSLSRQKDRRVYVEQVQHIHIIYSI